ncbi:MAG: hypothetical protein KCHDKBKB_01819 [Elusimicrobia bacterium]|nr:hypothetical protein [Elusimicrobiota bacterium]
MDETVKPHVQILDLRKNIRDQFQNFNKKEFDLIICTEIIEHLEAQFEDIFLNNMMHFVTRNLVFSWSPEWDPHRGTERQEHWNPRPYPYAINKLVKNYGLTFCEEKTSSLKKLLSGNSRIAYEFNHWIKNIMVSEMV